MTKATEKIFPPELRETVTFSEFKRWTFTNSDNLCGKDEKTPKYFQIGDIRKQWVGIGLIDCGPADGTEVLVTEDDGSVPPETHPLAPDIPGVNVSEPEEEIIVAPPIDDVDLALLRSIAEKATPGYRQWHGNTKTKQIRLATKHAGTLIVMDFVRWGMQGAKPRFQKDGLMHGAEKFVRYEVAPEVGPDPKDKRVYREDIGFLEHPDAKFMEKFSPAVILSMIKELQELRDFRDWYEDYTNHPDEFEECPKKK